MPFFINPHIFKSTTLEKLEEYRSCTGIVIGWREKKDWFIYDIFLTPQPPMGSAAARDIEEDK